MANTIDWPEIRAHTRYLYLIAILATSIFIGLLCFTIFVLFLFDLIR